MAIEFAREARSIALLDVQKKPLDDLKHALQQIYGKDHCRIYTYRCDLRYLSRRRLDENTQVKHPVLSCTVI